MHDTPKNGNPILDTGCEAEAVPGFLAVSPHKPGGYTCIGCYLDVFWPSPRSTSQPLYSPLAGTKLYRLVTVTCVNNLPSVDHHQQWHHANNVVTKWLKTIDRLFCSYIRSNVIIIINHWYDSQTSELKKTTLFSFQIDIIRHRWVSMMKCTKWRSFHSFIALQISKRYSWVTEN